MAECKALEIYLDDLEFSAPKTDVAVKERKQHRYSSLYLVLVDVILGWRDDSVGTNYFSFLFMPGLEQI